MSDSSERPKGEATPPGPSSMPTPEGTPGANGPEAKPQAHPNNQDSLREDPREALRRGLANNRLPEDQREQILAELPSLEEMERLYRELQENGGLSSEEFFASLGLDLEPQP